MINEGRKMKFDPSEQHLELNGFDYWRLCDELNIAQAALLIAGLDPSGDNSYVERWDLNLRPTGYEAAKAAISSALLKGAINGKIIPRFTGELSDYPGEPIDDSIDITESRVEVASLRTWLAGRGFQKGFFFPASTDLPDYLDPNNPRFAPKLAAAVHAWQAVTDPQGKTPKQALMKWLREHAADFELSDDEGKPNELGIEEVAKVANWQPGGGAPKTPGAHGE